MQTATVTPEIPTNGLVLVADDDPTMRVMARAALEQDGHVVAVAANGEEACHVFAERSPDIVLMDINMPVVDGYEACARLRRRADGARIPILMLTGLDDAEAIARAYAAGATDFQTKPVSWRVLCERVRYMLRGKQDADKLRQLAQYDSLTGLLNRATFRDQLESAIAQGEERGGLLAVIFLDLDCFKEINDTYGHGFGDQVLRLTAERLAGSLRSSDTVMHPDREHVAPSAGRFGGDEFTIIARDIPNPETATALADRIRAAFTNPLHLEGQEVFVTVSTGVSVYPFDGTDADTLLKHADAAMYCAKTIGRNTHSRYRPVMGTTAAERLSLAGELRRAVERGELQLCFQPKVDITTRHVVGAEALLRWQHPKRGLLLPGEFVELAEEIGLGPQIGDWVLRSALSQSAGWRTLEDRPVPIAVNLFGSQFRLTGLLDQITQTINDCGLNTNSIEVEITESVVMHNRLAACELLAGFKVLGIKTAIDDFGTGQSALGTLRNLHVDALKMDRSFIRDLEINPSDRAITSSIVDMGHHLGMTVIAEGVETKEQLEVLEAMGCDQAQGFLFSQGLPAEEFQQLLVDMGSQSIES